MILGLCLRLALRDVDTIQVTLHHDCLFFFCRNYQPCYNLYLPIVYVSLPDQPSPLPDFYPCSSPLLFELMLRSTELERRETHALPMTPQNSDQPLLIFQHIQGAKAAPLLSFCALNVCLDLLIFQSRVQSSLHCVMSKSLLQPLVVLKATE